MDRKDQPGPIKCFQVDTSIGVIGLTKDIDKIICGVSKGVGILDMATGEYNQLVAYPDGNMVNGHQLRSNDGSVDPEGNFWVGTMCDSSCDEVRDYGTLYRLGTDLQLVPAIEQVGIPNGLNWSDKYMYWTSSLQHTVYRFKWPDLSSKQPFYESSKVFDDAKLQLGEPDGSCLDSEGNLYVAVWGNNRVIKLSPTAEKLQEFVLPANHISCVTIGGYSMNQLFITSGKLQGDLGGAIFKVDLGDAKGVAKNLWGGPLV